MPWPFLVGILQPVEIRFHGDDPRGTFEFLFPRLCCPLQKLFLRTFASGNVRKTFLVLTAVRRKYAGRRSKENWRIHVSTNWNRIKRTHSNAESTGQKLSGAFCSYPHLGHGLGQQRFRGFYVHFSAN